MGVLIKFYMIFLFDPLNLSNFAQKIVFHGNN